MKTLIDYFIQEIDQEVIGTQKMLALVPADKFDWAPHEKSMKIKALATHIADIPTWISLAVKTEELDFEKHPYSPQNCENAQELLDYYEKNIQQAKKDLLDTKDDILEEIWTLKSGEIVFMQLTKFETIRHSLCQIVHHRAQLGVYLRLLNIPIPGMYGPSADDMGK